jgi:hypothetical protein
MDDSKILAFLYPVSIFFSSHTVKDMKDNVRLQCISVTNYDCLALKSGYKTT